MQRGSVTPSLSPSMDIQVSSNFERLLFELLDRDGNRVAGIMKSFAETGRFELPAEAMQAARGLFSAYRLDDEGTVAEIAASAGDGMVLDPHSAVGVSAARRAIADGTVASGCQLSRWPVRIRRNSRTRWHKPPAHRRPCRSILPI